MIFYIKRYEIVFTVGLWTSCTHNTNTVSPHFSLKMKQRKKNIYYIILWVDDSHRQENKKIKKRKEVFFPSF